MNPTGQPVSPPIGLPPEQFAAAFPFHLALDRGLKIQQVGLTLRRICPDVQPGADLGQIFRPIRPEGQMTLEWVLQHTLRFFLLEHRASKLELRGQFILLPAKDTLLFIGSPWFTDSSEIAAFGLGFDDFAIHDPVVDLLQVFQASKMALADAKKLADKLTKQRTALREANQRLLQQEAETRKLALIAARTDNAVVLTDAEGKTVWVNEGFTRITGYTLAEILGKKPGSVLQGPGTDPEVVRRIGERLRQGEGFSEEILNYGKDCRSYWLAIEVQPIRDESGQITNFMAIESDITGRRAAQRRLAIQFEVSRVLTEANNLDAAMPRLLRAICENLGWQLGQFWRVDSEGLRFVDFWHPTSARVEAFVSVSRTTEFARGSGLPGRVLATATPAWIPDVTRDASFPRNTIAEKEGLRGAFAFPVLVRGEIWGVAEFFSRNIEEPDQTLLQTFAAVGDQIGQFIVRREAQEALRETSTLQKAILEGANYSIISTAPDGTIQTFNATAERMLGYTSEEVVGKLTPAILHDLDEVTARAAELTRELGRTVEPGFAAFVARAELGKPDEREWTYIRKDGSRFPVLLSTTALFDEHSQVVGYLGIASDITESKRVASELLKAKEAAEAANRAKSEFLAMISHEIRTPMNGVLGMTELLLKTNLNSRQKEFGEAVAQSANALLHVIDDVLDFSKIEAGKLDIVSEDFSIRSLTDAVLEVVAHRDLDKKISLAAVIHHDVPAKVKGDVQRLRQVLMNLASNAVKFTEQGEVVVRVSIVPSAVGATKLRFEIKDTGIGLTEEQIQRLFQPFVQADQSASRRFEGTGLGLAISRRLVELMGGRIGVQSTAGAGSTFWFELPFHASDEPDAQRSHSALRLARAVICVRQPSIAESLLEQFQTWGVPCVASGTSADLLREIDTAIAQRHTPFVLCDDELLTEGGPDLLAHLGRLKERTHLILLANPTAAVAQEERALDLFKNVLLKPAKQSHVFDALVTAFEGRDPQTSKQKGAPDYFRKQKVTADVRKLSQLRILLAEDHHINRKLCLLMLEEFGVTADTANNGVEALAALAKQRYDLILMDCNMPEMDGYEATKSIRQLEATRHAGKEKRIHIIALTANVLTGERERCLALGMDDYLAKPFTAAELRAALFRALGEQSASAGPAVAISRLDQLVKELDRESVASMIGDYIKDLPVRVAELEKYSAQAEQKELERTAHSMVGVSASFGLDELTEMFRAIEEAAAAGDFEKTQRSLAPLKASTDAALAKLSAWLEQEPSSDHVVI